MKRYSTLHPKNYFQFIADGKRRNTGGEKQQGIPFPGCPVVEVLVTAFPAKP